VQGQAACRILPLHKEEGQLGWASGQGDNTTSFDGPTGCHSRRVLLADGSLGQGLQQQ
jgi:hypothetical protein